MRASPALDAALALARTPALAAAMRAQSVPQGTQDLLRVLAGEADALARAKSAAKQRGDVVIGAAELYVQQVLLHPNSDPFRVLGLPQNAERELARAHLRLLLIWLHPDRSDCAWRSSFTHRVIAAWKEISANGRALDSEPNINKARSSRRNPRSAGRPGLLPWVRVPLPPSRAFAGARRYRAVHVTLATAVFLLASAGPAESLNMGAPIFWLPEGARYDA